VQNILGTTKTVTLPTTKQADNMIISGWQASKVFDGAGNGGDTNTSENKKSSGGGMNICGFFHVMETRI
jgi:hypothetical protein